MVLGTISGHEKVYTIVQEKGIRLGHFACIVPFKGLLALLAQSNAVQNAPGFHYYSRRSECQKNSGLPFGG